MSGANDFVFEYDNIMGNLFPRRRYCRSRDVSTDGSLSTKANRHLRDVQ